MPRTIDNLGPDASRRYAEDARLREDAASQGLKPSAPQAEVDVTLPSFSPEMDKLLNLEPTHIAWGSFPPPPNRRLKRSFFAPDTKDRSLAHIQKVRERLQSMEDGEEKKALTRFFDTLAKLENWHANIVSEIIRFHKG